MFRPPTTACGIELEPAIVFLASGCLLHHVLFLLSLAPWNNCNIHLNTHTHIYIYIYMDVGKLGPLQP
jgi:hypothetical protein